jgi:hypothetical protein
VLRQTCTVRAGWEEDTVQKSRLGLLGVVIAALAVAAASLTLTRAEAQPEPGEEVVFVDNFTVFPDANGYVSLDFRDTDWTIFAECGGAYPIGGTAQLPSQVMIRQPEPRLLRMRLFNPQGRVVTTTSRVNCVFDIIAPAPVTPTNARNALHQALG